MRSQALADRLGDGLHRAFVEVEVADRARRVALAEQALGGEVGDGGVVLVHGA